jgi:hypothetical protein
MKGSIYKRQQRYCEIETVSCKKINDSDYYSLKKQYIDFNSDCMNTTTASDFWASYRPYNTSAADTTTWSNAYWTADGLVGSRRGESWQYDCDRFKSEPKSPETRLKEIIGARQAPAVHCRQVQRHRPPDEREARARQTLRRVIGDEKYKNFLVNGFVTVRNPKSGLSFQIFPGHGMTCVFDKGEMVDKLCVVLSGDFPPTDSIIMRYLMILNNEEQFRSIAVKWSVQKRQKRVIAIDDRSLTDIFKELKGVA